MFRGLVRRLFLNHRKSSSKRARIPMVERLERRNVLATSGSASLIYIPQTGPTDSLFHYSVGTVTLSDEYGNVLGHAGFCVSAQDVLEGDSVQVGAAAWLLDGTNGGQSIQLELSTVDGSAAAGSDYQDTTTTLTIPVQTIFFEYPYWDLGWHYPNSVLSIPTYSHDDAEGTKDFEIHVTTTEVSGNEYVISPTIFDQQFLATFSAQVTSVIEGESASVSLSYSPDGTGAAADYYPNQNFFPSIAYDLGGSSYGYVTRVDGWTSNGSATNGINFDHNYSSINFSANSTSAVITVPTSDDVNRSGTKSFVMHLQFMVGSNGFAGDEVALEVDILDDEQAADDSYTMEGDETLTVNAASGVLANDTDSASHVVASALLSGPSHGSLSLNEDGSFTYTPTLGFRGIDSFVYADHDASGLDYSQATVTINVLHPPSVNDDSYAFGPATFPDLTVEAPGLLSNDSDGDGDTLTASRVAGPSHGTVTINADGSFTYTVNANYEGPDSFTYAASDGIASATATVTIQAGHVPAAADNDYYFNPHTSLTYTVAAPGLLEGDTDDDPEDTLTASLVTGANYGPFHGTVTVNTDGSFSYTVSGNYEGPDSFTYRASDGITSATATVTVQAGYVPVASRITATPSTHATVQPIPSPRREFSTATRTPTKETPSPPPSSLVPVMARSTAPSPSIPTAHSTTP